MKWVFFILSYDPFIYAIWESKDTNMRNIDKQVCAMYVYQTESTIK